MAPKEQYSRADVRRQFGVSERQLRSWERHDLLAAAESYSFSDLIAVKTIVKLRENHIPARQIGEALASLRRKLDWVAQRRTRSVSFDIANRFRFHTRGFVRQHDHAGLTFHARSRTAVPAMGVAAAAERAAQFPAPRAWPPGARRAQWPRRIFLRA